MSPTGTPLSRTLPLLFLLLALLAYLQGVGGPWLYDDGPNLVVNAGLQVDGQIADEWRTAALSSGSGPLRRPMAMASFAAEYVIWQQLNPWVSKAGNILLHFLNAWLVFLCSRRLLSAAGTVGLREGRAEQVATLAALLWLLHPLHVSTVLYAVQRMAQLSTLFVLLGLYVYLRARQRWAVAGASPGELIATALWLLLCMALATLSKENGALLPWLLLVVEVCFFAGRWGGRQLPLLSVASWVMLAAPALLLLALYLQAPDWLMRGYASRDFSQDERLLTQGRLLWQYLGWILWPDIRQFGVHHDDIALSTGLWQPLTTGLALLAWGAVLALAVGLRRRQPLLLFALLFYLVGHAMESTLWPLLLVFEHRNYLPSVGLFLLLAWLLTVPFLDGSRTHPALPGVAVCSLLLVLLFLRASLWGDEANLARVNVENHPQSASSHYVYANVLLRQYQALPASGDERSAARDQLVAARYHFEQASNLDPQDLGALVTLYQLDSALFESLGKRDSWLMQINEVLVTRKLRPADVNALNTLMRCLGHGGCAGGKAVAMGLLQNLHIRYPRDPRIALLEYDYLQLSNAPLSQRRTVLESALDRHPRHQGLLYRLLNEAIAQGDMGAAYELGRRIMAADPQRRELTKLKALFANVALLAYDES